MSDFKIFKNAVAKQFDRMKKHQLYRSQIDKDKIWETYLGAFPPGTNPIRKERTEYDCQCCRSFIRQAGSMVAIIDGKITSIWDIDTDDTTFAPVAAALAKYVKAQPIDNFFVHTEKHIGTDKNYDDSDKGSVVTWNHFHAELPKEIVMSGERIGPYLSDIRSTKDVMLRSLIELTSDSVETVLELISQNSLYRGEEHKFVLESFQKLQKQFKKSKTEADKEIFCWLQVKSAPASVTRIRNTSIGTLLTDLSEGKELDDAVKAFESKVAPTNYKRPTAIVTRAMILNAQKTIESLGLQNALERRYATIEDITVNNILFVDRDAKAKMKGANVFDDLVQNTKENTKNFDKVEEITVDDFLANVLPKAESLEIMLENRHSANLVSLIAPVDPAAKGMFKWGNNFSWSYTGDVTDSIKERVKRAGGKVDGDLRCSLSWYNHDDLDFHMKEPGGNTIYFSSKHSPYTGGTLDVDMNAGHGNTRTPVENITYPDRKRMKPGLYGLFVHNFAKRENVDVGFEVEIEFDGNIQTIAYDKAVTDRQMVEVARIELSKTGEFKIIKSLPSTQTVKQIWGIPSQSFHKVSTLMLSPNYWDDKAVGNKHYFFMLDGCKNEGKARGFFNEFLSEELSVHRKVLEIVGAKMKTEETDRQLSGIGFSSTQRNNVLCKVKGNFTRTVKIVF